MKLSGGRTLVFDLGYGNVRALQRAKFDLASITDVFISHRHPDHCSDIAALLFAFRYSLKPKSGTLRLWGPKGFSTFVRRLRLAHEPWCDARGYDLEVREIGLGSVFQEDWSVQSLPVPHPTPALAYRLTYKGKSFAYSGDSGFNTALPDFASEADLFLLECASSEREAFDGHMTPRLALATLAASHCKRGVLTHVNAPALAELRKLKRPGYAVARDGQRFKL